MPSVDKTLGGVVYQAASDAAIPRIRSTLASLAVRNVALGHVESDVELGPTEIAHLVQTSGHAGNALEWVSARASLGRGIILVPIGTTTMAVATEDFRRVREHALKGANGFVLYEPAQGWTRVDEPSGPSLQPQPRDDDAIPAVALVGAAAALGLVLWLVWR